MMKRNVAYAKSFEEYFPPISPPSGQNWVIARQVEKHRAVASRAPAGRGRGGRARAAKHRNKQPKDKMAQLAAYFV